MTAQVIRDQDQYSGVRLRLAAALATAHERFHVDVNVGDPIWPAPAEIELPRLLGQPAISMRGYPMEMVLAEKTITALQLGIASTRWRDFGDIYQLTGLYHLTGETVRAAFEAVAAYRTTELTTLAVELDGYADVAQSRWFAWRSRHDLTDRLPESFQDVLDAVTAFADPVLTTTQTAEWDPATRAWRPPPVCRDAHADSPNAPGGAFDVERGRRDLGDLELVNGPVIVPLASAVVGREMVYRGCGLAPARSAWRQVQRR